MTGLLPAPGWPGRGGRYADLAIDAEQQLVDGLYRLASGYRSGATVCRWTGRRGRALVLAEAARLAQEQADIRRGATLSAVQPTVSADAWIALGYELGAAEADDAAFVAGYDAALDDAAVADAAAADTVPEFLGSCTPAVPAPPAAASTSAEKG